MNITREQLFNYFIEENTNFSFENFFKDDNADARAVIIITSNQILKTRNIKNIDNNDSLDHDVTYNYLNRLIYDILFDENGVMIQNQDIIEQYKEYIDFYEKQQNIAIYMYNDCVNNNKLIWVYLPSTITEFQYNFIEMLEKKYGNFLKKISKKLYEFNNDFLVGVSVRDENKALLGNSLDCVIKFINENNMVKNNDYIIEEKYIIGDVLKNDNKRKNRGNL